jgi:hypothetical protein
MSKISFPCALVVSSQGSAHDQLAGGRGLHLSLRKRHQISLRFTLRAVSFGHPRGTVTDRLPHSEGR